MAGIRTSSVLELLVALRRDDPAPLHRQLEEHLREAVRSGRLPAGSALPSSRALAREIGASRGIVVEAYEQLVAEGYLTSRPGGATRVATAAAARHASPASATTPLVEIEFRSGRPDLAFFPRAAWLRAGRTVLNEAPDVRFGYVEGHGVPELRAALSGYLNRVRGTAATPDEVVICGGFAQGMLLVAQMLRARGARRIAVEDPGYPEGRDSIRAAGLEPVGIPVDAHGIVVEHLAAADADAVVVTAAHQYPTGGVLPPERRAALLAWASAGPQRLVIEDDYDAEFRYDREPIGAVQGLDPGRVIYAGSASKILAPGLRLGWLIAPAGLVDELARAKVLADGGAPTIDQLVFAEFLERGELDRHLRRMRPIYRRRRDALLAALHARLPQVRPVGASAGLHVLAWLPPELDEARILRAARAAGIAIDGLGPRLLHEPEARGGLIFGYGSVPEAVADRAVGRLAAMIAAT